MGERRGGREGGREGKGLTPFPLQENYSKLQREHAELQSREQRNSQRVRELELEQQHQVSSTMDLRNKLDQCRQELSQYDTEKRTMTHQLSTKEVEFNQMEAQLKDLLDRLAEEAKEKTKKS